MLALKNILNSRQQGVGAGSAYVLVSFFISGALTFGFQFLSAQVLGRPDFGRLMLLWSATFMTVQILWIAGTQTLGRYISERESKGQDWRPVVRAVKRWQVWVLVAFVVGSILAGPLLTSVVFGGEYWLAIIFIISVAAYAPEYFRRGIFNGHRQFSRLGGQILAESSGRLLIAGAFFVFGYGVIGPAIAIAIAPIIGVLAVRPAPVDPPKSVSVPFDAGSASRFAAPVLVCMACAQAFANGGPLLLKLFGVSYTQIGLFGAALILTRVPQYVISPVIGSWLSHASRKLATEGPDAFDRFVARAAGLVGLVGVLMLGGTWVLGQWVIKLAAGHDYNPSRSLLMSLAALAAFYLICDLMNQTLFARGLGRLAALAWVSSLPFAGICLAVLNVPILYRVSISLVIGVAVVAVLQATFYLLATRKGRYAGPGS